MSENNEKVEASLQRVKDSAEKFFCAPPPNEEIIELDYKKLGDLAKKISNVIDICDKDNLIKNINYFINEIGLPEFEHGIASRGLLIAKVQGLELLSCLQEAKNSARSAGYTDPDIANIDLSSTVSAEFLDEVDGKLDELTELVLKLDQEIKSNKQSGISISAGPVSIDAGILIDALKTNTKDVKNYIGSNYALNAEVLKAKLQVVSSFSISLMQVIREKSSDFGRKISELTGRIVKVAAEAYISGLKMIKNYFGKNQINTEVGNNIDQSTLDPNTDPSVLMHDNDHAPMLLEIMDRVIENLLTRKISRTALLNSRIFHARLMTSHSRKFIVLYFLDKKNTKNLSELAESEDAKTATCEVGAKEFSVLKRTDAEYLSNLASSLYAKKILLRNERR